MKEEKPLYDLDDEMEQDDSAPLYNIEEEEENEYGPSRKNEFSEEDLPYAYGHHPESEERGERGEIEEKRGEEIGEERGGGEKSGESEQRKDKNRSPWGLLFEIMFSPVNGWRNLKITKPSIEKLGAGLFYPLCGLAAASQFLRLVFEANLKIESVIVQALIVFMSLFLSNFIIPVLAKPFMSGKAKEGIGSIFGRGAVMMLLSSIAIFDMLPLILPPLEPVFFFLPLWSIYLITRLPKFLGAPQDKNAMTITVLSLLVVGMPILWTLLLEWMLTGSTSIVL